MREEKEDLEALAERAAGGDEEAFRDIYESLLDPVFRYFYWSLGSYEDAEDLTEETFVRCLAAIGRFDRRKASLRTWVFVIARNVLVDHLRAKGKVKTEALESAGEVPTAGVEARWEEEERDRKVREALRELPEAHRQVLVMRYFLEMDNGEIARVLGRTPGAVNALRIRALRRLGKVLEKKGWL
ncbi:MAG: RNA polymerase sigma factor [Candidatus Geothermincolales bacterium]